MLMRLHLPTLALGLFVAAGLCVFAPTKEITNPDRNKRYWPSGTPETIHVIDTPKLATYLLGVGFATAALALLAANRKERIVYVDDAYEVD